MKLNENPEGPPERAGYSVKEVSEMFGKDRSWGYRQIRKGRIRATVGFGTAIITDQEVKRILGK